MITPKATRTMDDILAITSDDVHRVVQKALTDLLQTPNSYNERRLEILLGKVLSMKLFERKLNTGNETDINDKVIINDKLVLKLLKPMIKSIVVDFFTEKVQSYSSHMELNKLYWDIFFDENSVFNKKENPYFRSITFIYYQNIKEGPQIKRPAFEIFFGLFIDALLSNEEKFLEHFKNMFFELLSGKMECASLLSETLLHIYYYRPTYKFNLTLRKWFEEYADEHCMQNVEELYKRGLVAQETGVIDIKDVDTYFQYFSFYHKLCGSVAPPLVESERLWFIHEFLKTRSFKIIKHIWWYMASVFNSPCEWHDSVIIPLILKYYHGKFLDKFAETWTEYFNLDPSNRYMFVDTVIECVQVFAMDKNRVWSSFTNTYYKNLGVHKSTLLKPKQSCVVVKDVVLFKDLKNRLFQRIYTMAGGLESFIKLFWKYLDTDGEKHRCEWLYPINNYISYFLSEMGEPFLKEYYENYVFKQAIRDHRDLIIGVVPETPLLSKVSEPSKGFLEICETLLKVKTDIDPTLKEEFLQCCTDLRKWIKLEDGVLCFNLDRNTIPGGLLDLNEDYLQEALSSNVELNEKVTKANSLWKKKYDSDDMKRLTAMPGLSHGVVELPHRLPNGQLLNLSLNFFQYMVLDCFQDVDELTIDEILRMTNLKSKDIVPALKSFMKINLLQQHVNDKKIFFSINMDSASLKYDIKKLEDGNVLKLTYRPEPVVTKPRNEGSSTKTFKKMKSDKSWTEKVLEAKIVAYLKLKKMVSQDELLSELNSSGVSYGEIRDSLANLRDYYKFDPDIQTYKYVP